MECSQIVKDFNCTVHVHDKITRLYRDRKRNKLLYCVECIVEDTKIDKDYLEEFASGIQRLNKDLLMGTQLKLKTPLPSSLSSVLDDADIYLNELKDYFEEQLQKIQKEFQTIQEDISQMFQNTLEKVTKLFHKQYEIVRQNKIRYHDLLLRHFKFDAPQEQLDLVKVINGCDDSEELENIIRNYVENADYIRDLFRVPPEQLEARILRDLLCHKDAIQCSLGRFPESIILDQSQYMKEQDELMEHIQNFLDSLLKFDDEATPITINKKRVMSDLITVKDLEIMAPWISKGEPLTLHLIYRASERGFLYQDLLDVFHSTKNAILLFKTKTGEIIGSFRDRPRNVGIREYIEGIMTFSITNNEAIRDPTYFMEWSYTSCNACTISNSMNLNDRTHPHNQPGTQLYKEYKYKSPEPFNSYNLYFTWKQRMKGHILQPLEVVEIEIFQAQFKGAKNLKMRLIESPTKFGGGQKDESENIQQFMPGNNFEEKIFEEMRRNNQLTTENEEVLYEKNVKKYESYFESD